jgi:hypothetical protein
MPSWPIRCRIPSASLYQALGPRYLMAAVVVLKEMILGGACEGNVSSVVSLKKVEEVVDLA